MELIKYGIIGAVSGLLSSCWGAYKDSLYEHFQSQRFIRSIVAGSSLGILLFFFFQYFQITGVNLGVVFAVIVTLERIFTESFKAFVREEKQDKYKIPSRLHIFGNTIDNKSLRLFIGVAFLFLISLLFSMPSILTIDFGNHQLNGLFWGFFAGLVGSASGGAWKDAPIEGFERIKFFRSPIASGIWGIIFSFFTFNYSLLLVASLGGERMLVELYKTFIVQKVPGKFKATKPAFLEWKEKRKKFIIPYFITWIVFFFLLFS
ncbi:hypothetical protein KJ953_04670 [Patescibacteria group bacterium]|nr:hypothetical protein [Patescibacteria group bacterium]MBU1256774.1 hypothetical protein [Patescibacteria group bacterium]